MSSPAYLLKGELFLVEQALDKIRAEVGADRLSEASFDASVDASKLLTTLETPSLLGGRRLVIVRDAHHLGKDHVEALERYLASPSPHSIVVLVAQGRTRAEEVVRRAGAVIALDAPRGRALLGWVRERARSVGLRLDDRGGWALIDAVGSELRELDQALAQLLDAVGKGAKIGAAEVRRQFPRIADERIYAFTDAIGDRRLPIAMALLVRLLQQGEHPLVVFGALSGQIRRMVMARAYADHGPQAVGDALGMPGWRAERMTRQARAYREDELVEALGILAATDLELKGGDLPPEAALERAVVQIVSAGAA